MSLINCYECQKEMSDQAKQCPHCGAPNKNAPQYTTHPERSVSLLLWIGIMIMPFIFVWFLFRKGYSFSTRAWGVAYLIIILWFCSQSMNNRVDMTTSTRSTQNTEEQIATPREAPREAPREETREETREDARPSPSELNEFSANELRNAYEENTVAADNRFKNKWLIISGLVGDIRTDFTNQAYVSLLTTKDNYKTPKAYFLDSEMQKLSQLKKGEFIRAQCIGNGDIMKRPMLKDCTLLDIN